MTTTTKSNTLKNNNQLPVNQLFFRRSAQSIHTMASVEFDTELGHKLSLSQITND